MQSTLVSLEKGTFKQKISHDEAQFQRSNLTQQFVRTQNELLKLKTIIVRKYRGILRELMNCIEGTNSKDDKPKTLISTKASEVKKLLKDSKCKKKDTDRYLKNYQKN